LTLNVNGAGTSSNAYSFSGNIVDNGSGNGGLEVIKTGTGTQTLTGNITLDDDISSFLNVHEGKLVIDRTANTNDFTSEYIVGEVGSTLEFNQDFADTITLGFAHTSTAKDFKGTLELTGTTDGHRINISSGSTASDYENEQILSGSLKASGMQYLWKDGVGKLRLTGDSSTEFARDIALHNGTLIIGDGVDGGADFHASTIFEIVKGKLEIAENETISSNNVVKGGSGSGKDMIGGKGTIGLLKIGTNDGNNEVTVVSPGHGISSSLSGNTSQQQVSLANGSDSVGTFTATTLQLRNGGIYDWEISNFDGSAGSDWDVLAFNTLTFEGASAFDINIFGLQADGTAGANSGDTFAPKSGTSGFKFLDGSSHANINWGGFGAQSTGQVDSLFNINQQGWSHYNHHYGNWGVYYGGDGDFYLTYSAVPEPSTYMMVTGLLMLPGYNFVRRLRKKKLDKLSEEEEGNLS
jgi:hypothetical protein